MIGTSQAHPIRVDAGPVRNGLEAGPHFRPPCWIAST